jgi:hypothetical protein
MSAAATAALELRSFAMYPRVQYGVARSEDCPISGYADAGMYSVWATVAGGTFFAPREDGPAVEVVVHHARVINEFEPSATHKRLFMDQLRAKVVAAARAAVEAVGSALPPTYSLPEELC